MDTFSGPTVTLKPRKARPLWHGHAWIYPGAIADATPTPRSGDVVRVRDYDGQIIGFGLWDTDAHTRVRMLGIMAQWPDGWPQDRLPDGFWRGRISRALRRRRTLGFPSARSSVYRLVNAEGDGVPGLVVDRYGDLCAITLHTHAVQPHLDAVVRALVQVLDPSAVIVEDPDGRVREAHGITMPVAEAMLFGRKISFEPLGAHRPRRLALGSHLERFAATCRDAEVLDAFVHDGIFTTAAAAAGAEKVIALAAQPDERSHALRNAQLARVGDRTDIRLGKALDAMRAWYDRGRRFDRICLDPLDLPQPQHDAARALNNLVLHAARLLNPGGMIAVFSAHPGIDSAEHRRILGAVRAKIARSFSVVEVCHPQGDHPSPVAMPELCPSTGTIAELG